jgi:hypothetical protein
VGIVEMASEGKAAGESFDAQGTLVDVREVHLCMGGSLKGFVRPIGAIGAGIAAATSRGSRLIHAPGERDDEWCKG